MKTVSIPWAHLDNIEKHKEEENLNRLYFQCLVMTTVSFCYIVLWYFFPITLLLSFDHISFFILFFYLVYHKHFPIITDHLNIIFNSCIYLVCVDRISINLNFHVWVTLNFIIINMPFFIFVCKFSPIFQIPPPPRKRGIPDSGCVNI